MVHIVKRIVTVHSVQPCIVISIRLYCYCIVRCIVPCTVNCIVTVPSPAARRRPVRLNPLLALLPPIIAAAAAAPRQWQCIRSPSKSLGVLYFSNQAPRIRPGGRAGQPDGIAGRPQAGVMCDLQACTAASTFPALPQPELLLLLRRRRWWWRRRRGLRSRQCSRALG